MDIVIVHMEKEETSFDYLDQIKKMLGHHGYDHILVTGYGRHLASNTLSIGHVTEIKAHTAVVYRLFPEVRTILDISGQDMKVISLEHRGKVTRFEMNDRCAVGTGRFLEVMAQGLGCMVFEFGDMAIKSKKEMSINSTCTVFAETEVASLKVKGAASNDVAKAVCKIGSTRGGRHDKETDIKPALAFCGGVAKNTAIAKGLGLEVIIPPEPDFTGAIGAAYLASRL
ncbi:MAG: acyl-CoA dehydratase activase [Dissulfurimicrobium sp.]|uniref:acyl-CoA dehydratase activase n=1 Tax=Dissulfurimicrobium sp. TaxID=2022436 RepID=UPI004049E65C